MSDIGTEPSIRQRDILNNDYVFLLNLHFDEIVAYKDSSKIQIDEFFTYMGALFGFIVLAQKLIIYFIVRPKFEKFIQSHVSDPADFRKRTNYLEMYRVHKYCESKDMDISTL